MPFVPVARCPMPAGIKAGTPLVPGIPQSRMTEVAADAIRHFGVFGWAADG